VHCNVTHRVCNNLHEVGLQLFRFVKWLIRSCFRFTPQVGPQPIQFTAFNLTLDN